MILTRQIELWKMRAMFIKLNDSYAKFYGPTEHLVVDEIFVLLKGGHLQTCVTKTHKQIGIKLYNLILRDILNDMTVYLGKDRKCATPPMTATHATATRLTARIEHVGRK